ILGQRGCARSSVQLTRDTSGRFRRRPGSPLMEAQSEKGEPEMGRIVISENVTLDGVVQDPAGVEGFARGGWVGRVGDRGLEGGIGVRGRVRLVRTLLENDLVDELRLMVYPVVLGAGERLFGEASEQRPVRLVETRMVDDLAYLTYEVIREAA